MKIEIEFTNLDIIHMWKEILEALENLDVEYYPEFQVTMMDLIIKKQFPIDSRINLDRVSSDEIKLR